MRRLLICLGALVAMAPVAQAQTLSLEALEALALARHPAILESAARVEEARGRAAQSGAWDNPVIGATAGELRPRESPSGTVGGFIEQTIMLGGKRQAARLSAGAEVAVREADLTAVRRRVALDVRLAYYEVLAAAEKATVAERLLRVVEESVVITRQLVNVGIAERPDVLDAEADAARQKAALAAARAHQSGAWRRLAVFAADPALAAPAIVPALDTTLPVLDRQASLEAILNDSPELGAANAEIARQRAGVEIERRRTFPDLTFRADAAWNREHLRASIPARSVGWEFGAEAGVTLPLFNRNRGGILAAGAGVTASEAAAAQVRLELEARFSAVFEEYEGARLMAEAYKVEILPRLEQAFELHVSTYRTMATPYPQVLMAQRRLVETTEQYVDSLDRAWQAAVLVQGLLVKK